MACTEPDAWHCSTQQAVLIGQLRMSVSNEREAVHSILAVIVHWGYHKRIAL